MVFDGASHVDVTVLCQRSARGGRLGLEKHGSGKFGGSMSNLSTTSHSNNSSTGGGGGGGPALLGKHSSLNAR